jgi:hypothetical protein
MDRDRDFADAFEVAFSSLRRLVDAACAAETEWPAKAVAATSVALEFVVEEPGAARVLIVDSFANGLFGALRYRRMVAHFAALLEQGRAERADAGTGLPALTEEALVGSLANIAAERLRSGQEATLPGLGDELTEFVLTPYVGARNAKRIAAGRGTS